MNAEVNRDGHCIIDMVKALKQEREEKERGFEEHSDHHSVGGRVYR